METTWVFDDHATIVVQRAVRLRHELALDWPGIAVALTLMDDIAHLKPETACCASGFPGLWLVVCVCRMR